MGNQLTRAPGFARTDPGGPRHPVCATSVARNKRQADELKQKLMTKQTVPASWWFVRMLALVLLLPPLVLMACCYCILHKDR